MGLQFSLHEFKKTFTDFMNHCMKLAKAFQFIDNGRAVTDAFHHFQHRNKPGSNVSSTDSSRKGEGKYNNNTAKKLQILFM